MSAYALAFPPQREPALLSSFLLAAAMHAVLISVMFVAVRFQSRAPATVEVELWEAAPPRAEVKPQPPPPPPPPQVEPAKPVAKPDIAVQKKPEPKPKPKAKPEPKRDRDSEKRMREQLAMEQKTVTALDAQRKERELQALIAKREADARGRALATWVDKIKSKIRGRIPVQAAQAVPGNPEAVFMVSLLPTAEVLTVRMMKSSGNKPYDEAVERAILGASPLPLPNDKSLFQRQLELRFRPKDQPGS